jgi:Tol biopolymer transport system component
VTVCAERDGRWTQYQDFAIHVSTDSLGEWGVTYRRIAPGYEFYGHMGIYQRDLSNFDETPLIENTDISKQCLNCHTANRTNPDQYVFHVRGEMGATVISRQGSIEVLQARNDSLGGSMVYPYWHPGGRYCAFSTNKTSQMFHTANPTKRIEVYDSSSDVFVYDTKTRTILIDTLTMRKYWAENVPVFSPDGKWLYYMTAKRQIYPTDYDKEKYSLCRVAFDAETGKLGTQVDTLINTRLTGKSISWPRPSYDGRYIMYAQADYGYFSIWHPEADLWLLDLETGESRAMDEVNSTRAESLHNWSTNSRWFLFTSRRDDGLYSRLYLAHIDDQGRCTKPFMLPQQNPWHYYQQLLYSYNTPDFTTRHQEPFPTAHITQKERINPSVE